MAEEVIEYVIWTDSARFSFNSIVEYLVKEWSEKEMKNFIESTNKMLSVLKRHPEMCRPSLKRKYVRLGVLNKHTQIIYYYKPGEKQITILLFWNFKQNPQKLKY
jgi:plasmid stabilization system protein ParE